MQTREKKTSKMDKSGFTEEQLLQQQQELFKSSVEKYNQAGTTEPWERDEIMELICMGHAALSALIVHRRFRGYERKHEFEGSRTSWCNWRAIRLFIRCEIKEPPLLLGRKANVSQQAELLNRQSRLTIHKCLASWPSRCCISSMMEFERF